MKTKHNRLHPALFAALLVSACPALAESPAQPANTGKEIHLGNATITVSADADAQDTTQDLDIKALLKALNVEKLLKNAKAGEGRIEMDPIVMEHAKIIMVGPDGKVKEIDGDAAIKDIDTKALLKALNVEKLLEKAKAGEGKIERDPNVKVQAKIMMLGPDGKTKDIDIKDILKTLNIEMPAENAKTREAKPEAAPAADNKARHLNLTPDGKLKEIGDDGSAKDVDSKALLKELGK